MGRRPSRASTRSSIATWAWLVGLVVATCFVYAMAWQQGGPRGPNSLEELSHLPKCPIGGMPVNFTVFQQTSDGPIFFGCPHCIESFNSEPDLYVAAVRDQREFLATMPRVQVRCPVTGGPIRTDVFVERDGQSVYFGDDVSRAEFSEDPDEYAANLATTYTYQTKCPVSGDTIDAPISATTTGGEEIFFCSAECRDTYLEAPGDYASALWKQGIRLRR